MRAPQAAVYLFFAGLGVVAACATAVWEEDDDGSTSVLNGGAGGMGGMANVGGNQGPGGDPGNGGQMNTTNGSSTTSRATASVAVGVAVVGGHSARSLPDRLGPISSSLTGSGTQCFSSAQCTVPGECCIAFMCLNDFSMGDLCL